MTALQLAIPGVEVTPHGITGDLAAIDDASLGDLMARLSAASDMIGWALGDAVVEAMERLRSGDGSGIPAESWPSHQAGAARAVTVSLTYPPDERRQALTWAHHELVAHRDDRGRWLDVAEREHLSVRALRALIRQDDEDRRPQLDGMPPKPWRIPAKVAADLAVFWQDTPDAAVVLRRDGSWGPLVERGSNVVEMRGVS